MSLLIIGSLAACSKSVEVVLPNGETSKVEVETNTPVIDPFENYEMKFRGFDGYGKADFSVKDGAEKNDMLVFKVEKYSNLSNGDTIKVTADYSEKYKAALNREDEDLEKFVFTPAYKEYVVSDLEALTELDPFEGLKLEFDGSSPYVNVSINTSDCSDKANEYLYYVLEEQKGYKIGDTVTVVAYYDSSPDFLGEEGYIFTRDRCEYTVECDSEFINVKSEVDFTELNQNMFDVVEANANSWVGKFFIFNIKNDQFVDNSSFYTTIKSIDSVELCGSYLMSLKSPESWLSDKEAYNKYCNIYCVSFKLYDKLSDETHNCKVYAAYTIENISADKSGDLKYNNGQEFDSEMVNGYADTLLNSLESTQVIANKGNYNVLEIKE